MTINTNQKSDEILRLESLLYGNNYQVWLAIYGPIDSELGIEQTVLKYVSESAQISSVEASSADAASTEIFECLLYPGTDDDGPIDLPLKQQEVVQLTKDLIFKIGLKEADIVSKFRFKTGHPAYPVFWEFSFDIHTQGKRWIFLGSSSD